MDMQELEKLNSNLAGGTAGGSKVKSAVGVVRPVVEVCAFRPQQPWVFCCLHTTLIISGLSILRWRWKDSEMAGKNEKWAMWRSVHGENWHQKW